MRPVRVRDVCSFHAGKFLPELVYGSDSIRAFLLCLEGGQGLPARADSEEMICYCLEGRAVLTLGDQTVLLSAGEMAGAAAGMVRCIRAEERCVVLWVHASKGKPGD